MRWARDILPDSDLDIELLMLYLQRSVIPEKLVGKETVIRFHFTDVKELNNWWLVVKGDKVEVCVKDPGKEVDVYFTTDLRTMIETWMGDVSYRAAISDGRLKIVGPSAYTRDVSRWLAPSIFAGIRPAREIT